MSRRHCHRPHHESPQELRLWAIVDSLVTDISEKEAYLAFARELAMAQRCGIPGDSHFCRKQGTAFLRGQVFGKRGQSLEAASPTRCGTVPISCVGRAKGTVGTSGAERSPFSQRTKRVVMKWFRRGLSGHLMWLIGRSILR